MKRHAIAIGLIIVVMLFSLPNIISNNKDTKNTSLGETSNSQKIYDLGSDNSRTGILNPVNIEHIGTTSSSWITSGTTRTDVYHTPTSEVYLPAGNPGNYYSADCMGGWFYIGMGGSSDFGSPAGTISCWIKWDISAPHGRFWGQDTDFETRWSANRLVLDWGSDTTLTGTKNDWDVDHWYFLAITWNETTNTLAIYWGDEDTIPVQDAISTTWYGSVVSYHTENNIMNSISRAGQQVDGHVDDFRYYSIQRDLSNIDSDYNRTLEGSEYGLQHYYKFEGNLLDSTGTQNLIPNGAYEFNRDVWTADNGWRGEQIQLTVDDLDTLYILNGSFTNGNPGTNEDWNGDGLYHPDGWNTQREALSFFGRQRSSYVQDQSPHVILENEGYTLASPDRYRHYNGTVIYWYQEVDNFDSNQNFEFNMKYLYQNGPIGTNFENIFTLNFEIFNSSQTFWTWSLDLTNVSQRDTWYEAGKIPVNLTDTPDQFEARVSLRVNYTSSYIEIPATDEDLDGDSTNGLLISVLIDDISFTGLTSPKSEDVDLSIYSNETGLVNVKNGDDGDIAYLNHTYWLNPVISLEFSANLTVSFSYSVKISRMSRTLISYYTTSREDTGVAYYAIPNQDVNMTAYTYIPSYTETEGVGFVIHHPSDWNTSLILNTFGEDVTHLANLYNDSTILPIGEATEAGWWKIVFTGKNYVESIDIQRYDRTNSIWNHNEILSSTDRARCNITILSDTVFSEFEVLWFDPDGNTWLTDALDEMSNFSILTLGCTIGLSNATIGEWTVLSLWANETEVGFRSVTFEVHHGLNCFAQTPQIHVDQGDNFTLALYLYDKDTLVPVLSEDALVWINWTGSIVMFSPNLAKNWWEVDLSTAQTDVGIYEVTVWVDAPYYDESNCSMSIEITAFTVMTIIGNQYVELSPGNNATIKFRYMFLDGTGISNANISVLSWTGPESGLSYEEALPISGETGNYTIKFSATIVGTYYVTITGTKEGFTTGATSFYLLVGPKSTQLTVSEPGIPSDIYFNHTYSFSIFYHDNEGGVEGAGINYTRNQAVIIHTSEFGSGFYNITIRIASMGSQNVYFRFAKYGYDFAEKSFSFEVQELPTAINVHGLIDEYYEGRNYNLSLFYNSTNNGGIDDADFSYSLSYLEFFRSTSFGHGWYNFTLKMIKGTWNITIWIDKIGYQEQSFNLVLSVNKISISFVDGYSFNETYTRVEGSKLFLKISPIESDTHLPIRNASIEYSLEGADSDSDDILIQGTFIESNGNYTLTLTVPKAGLYLLSVRISKENYETLEEDINIYSKQDPEAQIISTIITGILGAVLFSAAVLIIFFARRYLNYISTRNNIEMLSIRGRFEDAKNLVGIQLIHRELGLPVYSKTIKGEFQEALVSSFISAISQFRAEFSMDEPMGTIIPISELILAVQTKYLICAMVTVHGASERQKSNLAEFSKVVSSLFDERTEILEISAFDRKIADEFAEELDPIFEKLFDIPLMKKYVGVKKGIPEKIKPIAHVISDLDVDYGISVEEIAKELIKQGHIERKAYRMVLDAVDGGYLIAGPEAIPTPLDST